jgi:hypothetical protein
MVAITSGTFPDWKRQVVTTHFVSDLQIVAGLAPLKSMRKNSSATGSELSEQMGEFVPESAIHFLRPVIVQKRV